jgi:hypothetical protein
LSFRAASLKLKPRDCFIGWSPEQKSQYLHKLANNNRFLILPWIRVKNLGSYLLAQVIRRLAQDWYRFYEQQLLLLETFVDPTHSTCLASTIRINLYAKFSFLNYSNSTGTCCIQVHLLILCIKNRQPSS